jgi:hypothetical protein
MFLFLSRNITSQVMLSSVATHVSKQSQVAHAAMIELNNACELFEHASRHGGRAVKFLVSSVILALFGSACFKL